MFFLKIKITLGIHVEQIGLDNLINDLLNREKNKRLKFVFGFTAF